MFSAFFLFLVIGFNSDDEKIKQEESTALALIQTSTVIPLKDLGIDDGNYYLKRAIQLKAIELEIMDEKELNYLLPPFNPNCEFYKDLDILRLRYEELLNIPFVEEINFEFPSYKYITDCWQMNINYQMKLEKRLIWESDRAEIIKIALRESEICKNNYNLMREATCEFYRVYDRRLAYKQFKEKMLEYKDENGKNYWELGKLPPYLPTIYLE